MGRSRPRSVMVHESPSHMVIWAIAGTTDAVIDKRVKVIASAFPIRELPFAIYSLSRMFDFVPRANLSGDTLFCRGFVARPCKKVFGQGLEWNSACLERQAWLLASSDRLAFSRRIPILARIMMRLFRSLVMFLALLGLSAGGMWDVANAHPMKAHGAKAHGVGMPQAQTTNHHHEMAAKADLKADHSGHHQHQVADTKLCLDASTPCGGDMPDHMGGMCCAAMACHMAVLPQVCLSVSAVAIRAANPLLLETDVEGTLGPRLERPPRSLVV